MKGSKIKLTTIILAIILIIMVGFLGIYTQVQNRMENQVKSYTLSQNLKGARVVELKVSDEQKEIVKNSEGNEVSDASSLTDDEISQKGYTKESVPENPDEVKTKENYIKSKEITEDRLKELGEDEYYVRLNEETGSLYVELSEDTGTDDVVTNLSSTSKFTVTSELTGEELMNNDDIQEVSVLTGSPSNSPTAGTAVYLSIQFNKEGTKKLEEISTKYRDATKDTESSSDSETSEGNTTETTTVDESGEQSETAGNVILKIDDEQLMTTTFDQVIRNGLLQLVFGQASTDNDVIQGNIEKAQATATLLRNKVMPIKYTVEENKFIQSELTKENLQQLAIVVGAVIGVILLAIVIKFKLKGLLIAISNVGLIALLLLLVRYANVMISFEGLVALVVVAALNIAFTVKMLCLKEKLSAKEAIKETYKKFFIITLPVIIMSIVFIFIKWVPVASFGAVMFWGFILIAIYNLIFTTPLLILSEGKSGGVNNEK